MTLVLNHQIKQFVVIAIYFQRGMKYIDRAIE